MEVEKRRLKVKKRGMEVEKRDKDGGEDGGEEETDEGRQYITFSLLFGVSRAEIFLNI